MVLSIEPFSQIPHPVFGGSIDPPPPSVESPVAPACPPVHIEGIPLSSCRDPEHSRSFSFVYPPSAALANPGHILTLGSPERGGVTWLDIPTPNTGLHGGEGCHASTTAAILGSPRWRGVTWHVSRTLRRAEQWNGNTRIRMMTCCRSSSGMPKLQFTPSGYFSLCAYYTRSY